VLATTRVLRALSFFEAAGSYSGKYQTSRQSPVEVPIIALVADYLRSPHLHRYLSRASGGEGNLSFRSARVARGGSPN
jgi:hypothetical protein